MVAVDFRDVRKVRRRKRGRPGPGEWFLPSDFSRLSGETAASKTEKATATRWCWSQTHAGVPPGATGNGKTQARCSVRLLLMGACGCCLLLPGGGDALMRYRARLGAVRDVELPLFCLLFDPETKGGGDRSGELDWDGVCNFICWEIGRG